MRVYSTNRLSPETDRHVERLTCHHTEVDGDLAVSWPPLIDWIETQITAQVKRGGASSGDGGAGGINEGALRVFNRIRQGVTQLERKLYMSPFPASVRVRVLRIWETAHDYRSKGELDDDTWLYVIEQFASWVEQILREDEDRPSRMELTVPCPNCGERWVLFEKNPDDLAAQDKRRAAVVIEYAHGRLPVAECRVLDCGGYWVGWEQVAALGGNIGATQDLAVLEACGITLPGLRQTIGDTL